MRDAVLEKALVTLNYGEGRHRALSLNLLGKVVTKAHLDLSFGLSVLKSVSQASPGA